MKENDCSFKTLLWWFFIGLITVGLVFFSVELWNLDFHFISFVVGLGWYQLGTIWIELTEKINRCMKDF